MASRNNSDGCVGCLALVGCLPVLLIAVVVVTVAEYWPVLLILGGLGGLGYFLWKHYSKKEEVEKTRFERLRTIEGLDRRLIAIETTSAMTSMDPGTALENPGWVVGSNPYVREFHSYVRQVRKEMNQAQSYFRSHPKVTPTDYDIDRLTSIVQEAETRFEETDRAVRVIGWSSTSGSSAAATSTDSTTASDESSASRDTSLVRTSGAYTQSLLAPRWSAPFLLRAPDYVSEPSLDEDVLRTVEKNWPIRRKMLVPLVVSAARPRNRSDIYYWENQVIEAVDRLTATGQLVLDEFRVIWPSWVTSNNWSCYRILGANTQNFALADASPTEVANVLWHVMARTGTDHTAPEPMDEWELFEQALTLLEYDSAPDDSQSRFALREALHHALATGRLQRNHDGRIMLLRRSWPASYRGTR